MSIVLSLHQLSKNYGKVQALQQVSFDVPQGCVFGILGPNGSGKTTLLGIIMNVLQPTNGSFTLLGKQPSNEVRKQIGTLLETPNFYHYLSGERNLEIAATIKGVSKADITTILEKVNLYERRQSKFSTYSLGMKQRLAIASALLGNPDVLVLDEPTNGLDPVGIAEIRNLIIQLANEGKTIIMASHLLDEVEKVCTHVAVLQKGKLLNTGTVDEVFTTGDSIAILQADDLDQLVTVIKTLEGVQKIQIKNNTLQVHFDTAILSLKSINLHCFNNGIVLSSLQLQKQSLESKFLALTGGLTVNH
jgi:ABC-2 type transport system ATP-binding protein